VKTEVSTAVEELKRQFPAASFTVREDGQGGAYVRFEPVSLGDKYCPQTTWIGLQVPAQYPYADIYPIFIGAEIRRSNGVEFVAPITRGHQFEGRAALQVSRRNGAAHTGLQKATSKVLKVLDYLEKLP
jgi:hypothetical protein